jgi:hypothetical protein
MKTFRISQTVLKDAAKIGLNLFQIGEIMFREDEETQSEVEKLVEKTNEIFYGGK